VLTDIGNERALSVIRRHRLWERFLTDILGMKWDKVHKEACRLEHVTSRDVENGLSHILGDVDTCPHGHYIPGREGQIKKDEGVPLSEFKPKQKVCIAAIADEDTEFLRKIDRLGLQPKTIATILKKYPDSSLEVEVNQKRIRLNKDIAFSILAKLATDGESATIGEEMPLSKLTSGQSGVVRLYAGGCGMLGRCLSLGLTPGSLVKMLKNFNKGPVLVKVLDTEVALGRELADKIIINPDKTVC
jgi:DtxR family Mn-dependent transcriptional regulator